MIKELKYYMQHDGLIPKPVVETPPDPEPSSNPNDEVPFFSKQKKTNFPHCIFECTVLYDCN